LGLAFSSGKKAAKKRPISDLGSLENWSIDVAPDEVGLGTFYQAHAILGGIHRLGEVIEAIPAERLQFYVKWKIYHAPVQASRLKARTS
jgi:hypothetical protein